MSRARYIVEAESAKKFFRHLQQHGDESAREALLACAPKSFVAAYRSGGDAEWEPDMLPDEWWPSYDDDIAAWTEYCYYFDYRVEAGKLYAVAMTCDKDGDHDGCGDEAEVGTPDMARLESEYGLTSWAEAMKRYWEWVIENRSDPLGYVRIPRTSVEKNWVCGFARDGQTLKLTAIRRLADDPPSPPAVPWPEVAKKAEEDVDWKRALEYTGVGPDGTIPPEDVAAYETQGKWNAKHVLTIRFSWTDQEAQQDVEDLIVQQATASLAGLEQVN